MELHEFIKKPTCVSADFTEVSEMQAPEPAKMTAQQILAEMTAYEVNDKYGHRSPEDSPKWQDLCLWAEMDVGARLAEVLMAIRSRGSILARHDQFGYAIQPVIGPWTWTSQAEYDQAKAPLMQYVNQLIGLLKRLREVYP